MPRQKKQVLKQRADGRYVCRYNGKWFMGRTSEEALAAREAYKLAEIRGELQPEIKKAPTVAEYIPRWLTLYKSGVSDKCYDDYAKQLEALVPVIGSRTFDAVTVDDAASVWQHFDGYSASTIKRARMLYIGLFDAAVENEYCGKNPFRAKYAQPPKAPSGSHRELTAEEVTLIRTTDHRFRVPALLMLYAGLRRGEVLALTPADIDLKAKKLSVNKAVRFDGNRPVIVDPKTEAGTRSVPVLDAIRGDLAAVIPSKKAARDQPLFQKVRGGGGYMTETAYSRTWESYMQALSAAAGHPVSFRAHDLRHTYCTMLMDNGIDIHQAMIWLGHSDEKMILEIYDHAGERRSSAAVKKLNAALKSEIGRQNGRQAKKQST